MGRLKSLGSRVGVLDTRAAKAPRKTAEPFYLTPEWRELMAALIRQRGRRCQACGREGCRIYGDHVVELQDGGAELDESNIKLLCGSCHAAKTSQARARRHAGPLVPTEG